MKFGNSFLFVSVLFCAFGAPASAAYFGGKFDVAATDSSSSNVRYYNAAQGLSIYAAPGPSAAVLQDAFFRKTYVSLNYTPQVCPPGITGTCGSLTTITVSAFNIP